MALVQLLVFIQVRISGSVRSYDTAHGQRQAFYKDEVAQLRRLLTKRDSFYGHSTRQEMLRFATVRPNRPETGYTCAACFQR